jgi:hypothetical protein
LVAAEKGAEVLVLRYFKDFKVRVYCYFATTSFK